MVQAGRNSALMSAGTMHKPICPELCWQQGTRKQMSSFRARDVGLGSAELYVAGDRRAPHWHMLRSPYLHIGARLPTRRDIDSASLTLASPNWRNHSVNHSYGSRAHIYLIVPKVVSRLVGNIRIVPQAQNVALIVGCTRSKRRGETQAHIPYQST